jgi:hypothetical protein
MLLKLQTYTMEVNKTLMEERIQVFSDLGAIKAPTTSDTDSIFLTQDETEVNSSSIDLRNLANEELFNK